MRNTIHSNNNNNNNNKNTKLKMNWNEISPTSGWVSDLADVEAVISTFSRSSNIAYVSGKKERFGKNVEPDHKSRLHFEDKSGLIPFDGVPFIFIGTCTKECLFGRDKHRAWKSRQRVQREDELMDDHPRPKRRRTSLQPTKKKGCTAKIAVKEVVRFPKYIASKNTERVRKTISKCLRSEITLAGLDQERRFYISLPAPEEHTNHPVSQLTGLLNPVSKEIREKIFQLVSSGVTSVSECKRHLRHFIGSQFAGDVPDRTNMAYFPLDETIRKHMYLSQQRLRYSQLDQENLLHLVAKWTEENPEDRFTCIPSSSSPSTEDLGEVEQDDEDEVLFTQVKPISTSFFFCHQSKYQRHLLRRYGNEICLLDATYKTTKYSLPLFFLAVPTNMGYSVVGEFVVENETTESIKQGLSTLKGWMSEDDFAWNPRHFMTDFCEREICAIEQIFPETFVYLCDFHREQSWNRWLSKKDNGLSHCKEHVLTMLRQCAHACSEESFQLSLDNLQSSAEWVSNSRLRTWISRTWLPEKRRWVWAYRSDGPIVVNTNNGLERQNQAFKYTYLEQRRNLTLSAMVSTLIDEYLPSMMLRYVKDNVKASDSLGGAYVDSLPKYLQNRPPAFIKHCMSKIELAEFISPQEIENLGDSFVVQSQSDGEKRYHVQLDGENHFPKCDCQSWASSHLPCKHMFAVISHIPAMSWDSFPESYRSSHFFTLDGCISGFVCATQNAETPTLGNEQNTQCPMENSCDSLPSSKVKSSKSIAALCRERLSLITSNTYICDDCEVLDNLAQMLLEAHTYLDSNLRRLNGLVLGTDLNENRSRKQTKITNKDENSKTVIIDKVGFKNGHVKTNYDVRRREEIARGMKDLTDTVADLNGTQSSVQCSEAEKSFPAADEPPQETVQTSKCLKSSLKTECATIGKKVSFSSSVPKARNRKGALNLAPFGGLPNPIRMNLCFANSTLQCLKTTDIMRILSSHELCDPLCFICQIRAFYDSYPALSSLQICQKMQDVWPTYHVGSEQDVLEMLQLIMNQLQRVSSGSRLYAETFEGQLENSVSCGHCGARSVNIEVYNNISLSIKNTISLRQSVSNFFAEEEIDGYICPSCNISGKSIKQNMICSIPKNLIFHLKRFDIIKERRRKDSRNIEIDEEIRLASFVKPELKNSLEHKGSLTAAIVHYGSMSNGHYFCFCRSGLHWYRIDDTKVTKVKMSREILGEAYMLFFRMQPRPYIN